MTLTPRILGSSLLLALGLSACERAGNDGIPRKSGGPGFVDVTQQMAEIECGCLGELEGPEVEAECRDTYLGVTLDDELATCIDQVLADHADAVEPFSCMLDAEYDLLECAADDSCAAFTCANGDTINEQWVCDGEPDCDGGEDERQDCPASFSCDDTEIPGSWVCDGWEDCSDGSDEPASCEPSCLSAAAEAMLACPSIPDDFEEVAVDSCFDFEAEPGTPVPACDDGSCSRGSEPSALIGPSTSTPPRRSHALTQALRHTIRPR